MSKRKSPPFINMGTSLLLVVFIVICMVMFAALSISTARSNLSMSESNAERRSEYYAASNTAEEVVQDLYEQMQDPLSSAELHSDMCSDLAVSRSITGVIASFSVPVNDHQVLEVVLNMDYFEQKYDVERWAVVNN